MKQTIKVFLNRLPYVRDLNRQVQELKSSLLKYQADPFFNFAPPGHYYSPLPSIEEITADRERIFRHVGKELPGIRIDEEKWRVMIPSFKRYYEELPFEETRKSGLRYYFDNDQFRHSDAILLYFMLRYLKPNKVIEIGSGFSSCVILDTSELFLDKSVSITFIDPYPKRLYANLKQDDKASCEIFEKRVQDAPLETFSDLTAGDILFVDSSHVAKVGGDVNYIFFEIFPTLSPGVYIHVHDIFWPFEYPEEWFWNIDGIGKKGMAWDEAYFLRAFLSYNENYEIIVSNGYLNYFYYEEFAKEMPLLTKGWNASIWLRKAR